MSLRIRIGILGNTFERECVARALAHLNPCVEFVFDSPLERGADPRRRDPQQLLVCAGESYLQAFDIVTSIRQHDPDVNLIAIVGSFKSAGAVDLLLAGATAVFSSDQSLSELSELVSNVAHGRVVHPPEITSQIIARLRHKGRGTLSLIANEPLTSREREIGEMLSLSNKEIAKKLFLSLHTVKNHIHKIIEKLEVKNRQEAALYLLSRRGLPPEPAEAPQLMTNDGRRQNGNTVALSPSHCKRLSTGK